MVESFRKDPLLLVINLLGVRASQALLWIVQIYLTRWKIEATLRFIKKSYNVEDILVMSYQRLRSMVMLVTEVDCFAPTFLGQERKQRIVCEKTPRHFTALVWRPGLLFLCARRMVWENSVSL